MKKKNKVENPKPPKFKQDKMPITYMQNGIKRISDDRIRLSLPKELKAHMSGKYGIDDDYLYLRSNALPGIDNIKQLKFYPTEDNNNEMEIVIVYEVDDVEAESDNGNYLSIDPGLNNILACYNRVNGETFILGKQLFSIERKFLKKIGRVQSAWYTVQAKKGVEYPKTSRHIIKLYSRMNNALNDYTHKRLPVLSQHIVF